MMDNYRHKGLRKKLVEEIKTMGIADRKVLQAMNEVPRHLFLPSAFLEYAYQNRAFKISAEQTISHPYTVAFQSQLLQLQPLMSVLEIGTGSGYQAAVLCALGAKVFSVERHKVLHDKAKRTLLQLGYKPYLTYGDGYKGLPAFAPFDRIIITCAAPVIPQALIEQLKPGGLMVVPLGADDEPQEMTIIEKLNDGSLRTEKHGKFRFVPMLEKKESSST